MRWANCFKDPQKHGSNLFEATSSGLWGGAHAPNVHLPQQARQHGMDRGTCLDRRKKEIRPRSEWDGPIRKSSPNHYSHWLPTFPQSNSESWNPNPSGLPNRTPPVPPFLRHVAPVTATSPATSSSDKEAKWRASTQAEARSQARRAEFTPVSQFGSTGAATWWSVASWRF